MNSCHGYAAKEVSSPLVPFTFERRELRANDVQIEILYCGVCHSDMHRVHDDWNNTIYPVVPGHEIVGKVIETGKEVTKFKKGDTVGVGVIIDSCGECDACKAGEEHFCEKMPISTYNGKDRITGDITYGGYSQSIIVTEKFVLKIPEGLDLAGTAPLLCAGITTYSALKHWKAGEGKRVGIVGLGGLGHVAIKLANAMNAEVIAFTTSPAKKQEAIRLGATQAVLSTDKSEMQQYKASCDIILSTVPTSHDINPYLELLKTGGTLVIAGVIGPLESVINGALLVRNRRSIAGSYIGGIAETQEMLEFCAKHNIVSDIETINMQDINTAFERLKKGDVKYRFVIDMASLK